MKFIVLLLNVAWFVLAAAEPAHAGPLVAAIGAIVSAIGSAGFVGKILLSVGMQFASSLLQKALAPKQKQMPTGVVLDVKMGDDLPVSSVIGRYATSGKRKYIGARGDDGKTPNAFLIDVLELGNIPVGDIATLGLWVNDEKCTILRGAGDLTTRGYPIEQFRVEGEDYAWIHYRDGNQTAAMSYLTTNFGTHPDRPWTSKMIGIGCPYAVMTYRFHQKVFPNGLPSCVFEPGAPPLYDIRKDSTNGGNGSHRWNDRSTWEPSQNFAVMIYNAIRGIYYAGEWFFGGQDLHALRLPASSWIASAQECGRLIDIAGGGTEPQFRGGYEITGDMEPIDVIDDWRMGCNGRLAENGGSFKLNVGAFGAAVFFITDDDIIVTENQTYEPFPSRDDTVNMINISFPEPAEKWATKDAPTLKATDILDEATGLTLFAADGNRVLPADVSLAAVPFKRQAQRIRRAMLKEERRFRTHQFTLPPEAWVLEPNDVIAWSSNRNGYTSKKFLILAIEGEMSMNQLVTIREIDPTDYDWSASFELPTSEGWTGKITAPVQPMSDWLVEADFIGDSTGAARRPAIKISCSANLEDVARIWVKVRNKVTGVVVFDSDDNPYAAPFSWKLSGDWCLPATQYEAQGKFVPFTDRQTSWGDWQPVTTFNLLLASEDIFNNAIIASKIADAAITASKIMDDAVTSLKLANQAVTTTKLAVAAVTAEVLASNSVIASKIADAAVTAAKLAAAAVDATKFASSIEPITVVATLPTTRVTGGVAYQGKLYRWNGSAYVVAVDASEVTGQITSTQIANGSISTPKLAANAVTANEIAANSITTAKIAAGAVSADQIAANAIIAGKIAAGAISADKLAVGTSNNQIPNADFNAGTTSWGRYISGGAWTELSIRTDTYAISTGSLEIVQTDPPSNGQYADVYPLDPALGNTVRKFTVQPGQRYELSVYVFGHRSDYCRAHIEWSNAAGSIVGYDWADAGTHQGSDPGKSIANYSRIAVIANAPASAVSCKIFFRCWGNSAAYGTSSYTWLAHPYFGEAQPNQTQPSVWSSGAVTLIDSGNIVTGSVTTVKLAALAVTADKIAAGAITAGKIQAGSITGVEIAAETITGSKIAANTIGADKVAANSITAKQLVLTDFNNLVPDAQMIDATGTWGGAGWGIYGDHTLFTSYNGWWYYAGPWGSGGYTGPLNSKEFPVKPSTQYLCVGAFYSNNNYSALFRVTWLDGTGAYITYNDILDTGARAAGAQGGRTNVIAPSNARRAVIQTYVQRDSTGGPVYFGGVGVFERNGAELIVDGGIIRHLAEFDSRAFQNAMNLNLLSKREFCDGFSDFIAGGFRRRALAASSAPDQGCRPGATSFGACLHL